MNRLQRIAVGGALIGILAASKASYGQGGAGGTIISRAQTETFVVFDVPDDATTEDLPAHLAGIAGYLRANSGGDGSGGVVLAIRTGGAGGNGGGGIILGNDLAGGAGIGGVIIRNGGGKGAGGVVVGIVPTDLFGGDESTIEAQRHTVGRIIVAQTLTGGEGGVVFRAVHPFDHHPASDDVGEFNSREVAISDALRSDETEVAHRAHGGHDGVVGVYIASEDVLDGGVAGGLILGVVQFVGGDGATIVLGEVYWASFQVSLGFDLVDCQSGESFQVLQNDSGDLRIRGVRGESGSGADFDLPAEHSQTTDEQGNSVDSYSFTDPNPNGIGTYSITRVISPDGEKKSYEFEESSPPIRKQLCPAL